MRKKRESDGFLGKIELGLGFFFFFFVRVGIWIKSSGGYFKDKNLIFHLMDSLSIIMSSLSIIFVQMGLRLDLMSFGPKFSNIL